MRRKEGVTMKTVFRDKHNMECIFTDEGIIFCDNRRDVFYPYGGLDSINLSLLGVMQAVCNKQVCCFNSGRQDKAEMKKMVQFAKDAREKMPMGEPVTIEKASLQVDESLPAEEQLKQFKAMFVQGMMSKAQYDLKKKILQD